ncbi:MAG: formimidoylglutamase [Bacteroidota bacterium]
MNIRIFFDPVPEALAELENHPNSFLQNSDVHSETFPLWPEADIAIIGINDSRGSYEGSGETGAADAVRVALYSLKRVNPRLKVADLGNLRPGINLEESHLRLSEVCSALKTANTIPVIIGGTHDFTLGQIAGFDRDYRVHPAIIDSVADMEDNSISLHSRNFMAEIFGNAGRKLSAFTLLGYQSYLIDREYIDWMDRQYFNTMRLGELRGNMAEAEPWLRDADLLSVDLAALKRQDVPGSLQSKAFGLLGEEACLLCRYAGLGHKMSSFGLYGYSPSADIAGQTAFVAATMIWYFCEGFSERMPEPDPVSPDTEIYSLPISGGPDIMVFLHNTLSGQWYIQLDGGPNSRMLPCSYRDYLMVKEGDLPDRFVNAIARN